MEMLFLLNDSLGVLPNKPSSYWYIAFVGISLKMVFLYKFELAKMAPNSVNTHLKDISALHFQNITVFLLRMRTKYT